MFRLDPESTHHTPRTYTPHTQPHTHTQHTWRTHTHRPRLVYVCCICMLRAMLLSSKLVCGFSLRVVTVYSFGLLPRCPSSPCPLHPARLHRRLLGLLSPEALASALAPVVGLSPALSPSSLQWLTTPVPKRPRTLRLLWIRLLLPLSFPRRVQMCQMHLVPQPLRSCCLTLLLALLLGGNLLLQSLPLAHPSPQF